MLAAANNNNNNAATPKRRGSSSNSLQRGVELRREHSSSINLDVSERSSSLDNDGNDVLRDTSERSYHQQSEELVHNTSDSSFIKVALLKQKQKIWNEQQGEVDSTSVDINSWDRKLSILKQKQRNREDINEQCKQQQQQKQRLDPTRVAASDTTVSQTTPQLPLATNNNKEKEIDIITEGQHTY